MAPRTRSNRAEKLANERLLATGITLNSRGFPALPNELFLEILGYLPAAPIPQLVWFKEETNPHRQVTLLSLSQTCRALRSFFLRYAWERIEVFGGMWTPVGRLITKEDQYGRRLDMQRILDMNFVKEIVRQLETVTVRNPVLGKYVRIVNVMFVNVYHTNMVLPELAQSLSLLPGVRTLQIASPAVFITDCFSEYSYPEIHTVCLRCCSSEFILPSCPNVKRFESHGIIMAKSLSGTCASPIETLGVLSSYYHKISLEDVVSGFPRLRDVAVDFNLLRRSQDEVCCLSLLPLHTIRLYLCAPLPYRPYMLQIASATSLERTRWVELAIKTLKQCSTPEGDVEKRVLVINEDMSVVTHPVFP